MMFDLSDDRLFAACAIVVAYFALTMYCLRPLWRRRATVSIEPAATLVAYASQTGFAQQLASQTAESLRGAGQAVRIASVAELDASALANLERALFIVSTTGEGDAPDAAAAFLRKVLSQSTALPNLHYGLLALGDREYDNFCAFGHQLDTWLRQQGARSMFDVIEVDNGDDGALRHWQHNLSLAFDAPDLPDWEAPTYEPWYLTERTLVNPGSAGDPCFHIELKPAQGVALSWNAGDLVEIDPFNSHSSSQIHHPHREYSIASITDDGSLQLLVRRMHRSNGELGLGSGWLTQHAALHGEVHLRIRSNPNFHPPLDSVPLILVGNGTGIAGLRALLRARIKQGHDRNWLLFGERSAAHDRFYRDDLAHWQAIGALKKVDLVFSRDQPERRYVQHRLAECSEDLREWIDAGAHIYVCGSLEGMAPGVHAVLVDILGDQTIERLMTEGRYRRDVY